MEKIFTFDRMRLMAPNLGVVGQMATGSNVFAPFALLLVSLSDLVWEGVASRILLCLLVRTGTRTNDES